MTDDRRVNEELAALAWATLEGRHGNLDSSLDALPCCAPCGWCHTPAGPAGAVLGDAPPSPDQSPHSPLPAGQQDPLPSGGAG